MVKEIVKDQKSLMIKSEKVTPDDLYILDDLIDTLDANRACCVGMAANMIGYNKCILVYMDKNDIINYMINPTIIKCDSEYETEEGCLSLLGVRKTKRFQKIKVEYYNDKFQKRLKVFTDFEAEIIQHEMDHFNGIII
ncbi:MAG: peptide deformylase [Acholeplasmatales bacterium]|nr:peptide deformylase [Acholeplasmatales bacterium]